MRKLFNTALENYKDDTKYNLQDICSTNFDDITVECFNLQKNIENHLVAIEEGLKSINLIKDFQNTIKFENINNVTFEAYRLAADNIYKLVNFKSSYLKNISYENYSIDEKKRIIKLALEESESFIGKVLEKIKLFFKKIGEFLSRLFGKKIDKYDKLKKQLNDDVKRTEQTSIAAYKAYAKFLYKKDTFTLEEFNKLFNQEVNLNQDIINYFYRYNGLTDKSIESALNDLEKAQNESLRLLEKVKTLISINDINEAHSHLFEATLKNIFNINEMTLEVKLKDNNPECHFKLEEIENINNYGNFTVSFINIYSDNIKNKFSSLLDKSKSVIEKEINTLLQNIEKFEKETEKIKEDEKDKINLLRFKASVINETKKFITTYTNLFETTYNIIQNFNGNLQSILHQQFKNKIDKIIDNINNTKTSSNEKPDFLKQTDEIMKKIRERQKSGSDEVIEL